MSENNNSIDKITIGKLENYPKYYTERFTNIEGEVQGGNDGGDEGQGMKGDNRLVKTRVKVEM